jgi:uncharacterized short protein YbdD (DUF466 family)
MKRPFHAAGDDFGSATPQRKQAVRAIVEFWRPILFLHAYRIYVKHSKTPHPDEPICNAECLNAHPYFQIKLTIFPVFWSDTQTDKDRSDAILHELCHAITHKQKALTFDVLNDRLVRSQEVTEANETATDWIARIIAALAT